MSGRWRPLLVGGWAALVSPLWLRGRRWRELLDADAAGAPGLDAGAAADPAIRDSYRALAVLGRVPGGVWRSTCLYRSVAECLVLRRYGIHARLRIGVGREPDGIVAHAWVVRPGQLDAAADARAGQLRILDTPA